MKKLYKLTFLVSLLIIPSVLFAQTWKPMGLDESNNPSVGYAYSNVIAFAPDGTLYTAFNDDADKNTVTVKKFDGQKWLKVGTSFHDGDYATSVSLALGLDGTPYISYNTYNPDSKQALLVVRKLIGDTWVKLGNLSGGSLNLAVGPEDVLYASYSGGPWSGVGVQKFTSGWIDAGNVGDVAGSATNYNKIAFAPDGSLYVAYAPDKNKNKVSVKKLVAGKWELVGTDGFSSEGTKEVNLSIAADGTPYVAYKEYNGSITVQQFKNGTWGVVSVAGLSKGVANYLKMVTAPLGRIYIAFCDAGDSNRPVVKQLSDGNWTTVDQAGLPVPTQTLYTNLAVSPSGTLYLTFAGAKETVKKLILGRWVDVGMGSVSIQSSRAVIVKVSKTGATYAAFNDAANYGKVSVKQYQSGTWQNLGAQTLSDAGIYNYRSFLDMDLAPDGTPYIIYRDSTQQSCVIKKYNGTTWLNVGSSLGQYGGSDYKITIAPNGTPYIAYYDEDYASMSVQKFSNGNWSYLAAGKISNGFVTNPIIVFDNNSVPYISFNSGTGIVMKRFDGNAWVTIPTDGLGTLNAGDFNFTISPAGTLYAGFYDTSAQQIVVSMFTNNKWQPVGGSTGSGLNAFAPKLLFDKTGQVYLAFLQYNSALGNYPCQLRKLSQGAWVDAGGNGMVPFNATDHSIAFNPNGDLVYAYLNGAMFVRTNTGDDLAAAPDIKAISPTVGSIGTTLTINGFNFSNVSSVKIGGTAAASFTVVSPTLITAVIAAGATGPVTVSTTNGSTEFGLFKFNMPPPVIRSFSPRYGDVNSVVTIKGKYFSPTVAGNLVYFGAVAAQVVTANDSTLTVKVPVGASAMPLTLTTRGFVATSGVFNVTFKSSNTFTANTFAIRQNVANVTNAGDVAVQDMNSDGKPDVIVTGGGTSVLSNTSTKSSLSFKSYSNRNWSGDNLAPTDLDGDGKHELIISTGNLSIFKNASTLDSVSFSDIGQIYTLEDSYQARTVDLDGDGRNDIVTIPNWLIDLTVYRNNSSSKDYIFLDDPIKLPVGGITSAVAIGDLDGDGKPDLAVTLPLNSDLFGYIDIYKNTSTPGKISFTKVITPKTLNTGKRPGQLVMADIDNDGRPELIEANTNSGTVSVFKNTSSIGSIAFAPGVEFTAGSAPAALAVADLDGDSLPDIAVANHNSSNTVSILKNTTTPIGAINFGDKIDYKANYQPGSIVAADLDGDQAPELIVSNYLGDNATIFKNSIIQFNLPANNFTLSAVSVTCKGSSNGIVNINALQAFTYTATLTGNNLNKTKSFTTTAAFTDLPPGTYNVCITMAELTGYQQCYDMVITEPKDLTLYSTINAEDKTVDLAFTGASVYNINLNGTNYTTTNASISLPLNAGNNKISISTDKECQGQIEKMINLSGIISPYPIPFQNVLNVNIGLKTVNNISVQLYEVTNGKIVYTQKFSTKAGVLQLDMPNLKSGIYTMHLTLDGNENIFKVIKQ